MSLGEIQSHLKDAHDETEASINMIKGALDGHVNRAHTSLGAAMAAGLSGNEIDQLAAMLTRADTMGNELIEQLSATMSGISMLGSL